MGDEPLKEIVDAQRAHIRDIGEIVKSLMSHDDLRAEQIIQGQHGEMKANIMLAYRHLEDARMRLGKVLQARDGGVSCYDGKPRMSENDA